MAAPLSDRKAAAVLKAFGQLGTIRGAQEKAGVSYSAARRIIREAHPDARRAKAAPASAADLDGVLVKLRKKPMTLAQVAAAGDVTEAEARDWLDAKRAGGFNLVAFGGRYSLEPTPAPVVFGASVFEVESDDDGTYTLGACGDSHMCSKYERLDVLNSLYDDYKREGVRHVFHTGNWIDGEARFNKYDLHTHGMDAQVRYLAEQYPRRKGVHTYAVAGDDHEGWYCQQSGVDIGRYAETRMREMGRTDWTNLGYMEAFVRLRHKRSGASTMLHVVHPGGGSAYALSYTVQKFVESYAGGEKPGVLFLGHYHKMEKVVVRGVFCVQTGCTQDQTPFMRKKKLEAHVGGHVVRLRQDARTGAILEMDGIKRYFNIGFYNDRWSHSGPVNLPKRTLGGVA